MLEFFKTEKQGRLQKIEQPETESWINLVEPTEEELLRVVEETGVEKEFLMHSLDPEEKARIDQEKDQTLIIINIPTDIHDDYPEYSTIPLGIIIVKSYVITICGKPNNILDNFKENRVKSFFTAKKTRFVFQIFYQVARSYLKFLKVINNKSEEIEQELHRSLKNEELFALLNLEKSLVYFTTSLKSNEAVMEKIFKFELLSTYEEDREIMDDAIIENKQALEMANIYSNILSGMMDAFASVISNNLNIVMKLLASITIILSLPTMVASFYGMNVRLPFMDNPAAFSIIMIISVVISVTAAFILYKKNLF